MLGLNGQLHLTITSPLPLPLTPAGKMTAEARDDQVVEILFAIRKLGGKISAEEGAFLEVRVPVCVCVCGRVCVCVCV
jgi:hypothetical protein